MDKAKLYLEVLLKTSNDGLLFIDNNGVIVMLNQMVNNLFGYPEQDFRGRYIWELPSAEKDKQLLKQFFHEILLNHPTPCAYFDEIYTHDDRHITIQINWDYIFDGKNIDGLLCIIEDKSESTDHPSDLTPTILEQVQYSRLATVEEVVARIAHELNQPLSAIINFSGGTLKRLEAEYPSSDIMQSMKMILRQAKRAGDVIDRMKVFLKKGELRKESLNINHVIKEVVECMRPELGAANIRVDFKLENLIPAVVVDKVQIEQVLLNIIQNALEAMRETEVQLRTMTIKTYTIEMKQLAISITDNGHGIDESALESIFEAFYTTKHTGMGIGLAISQSIVKAHGGEIMVESTKGFGTTFTVLMNLTTTPILSPDSHESHNSKAYNN